MKTTFLHFTFLCLACLFLACWEGKAQTPAPTWRLAKTVGTFANTVLASYKSSASDSQGNVYLTGTFMGTLDFGGITITSKGGQDAYLLKSDPCGNIIWAKTFGGTAAGDAGGHIHVDYQDNIYVHFFLRGAGFVDNQYIPENEERGCLVKYRPDGTLLWYNFPPKNISRYTILADAENNVYLYGIMFRETQFGDTIYPLIGSSTLFLVKYNALGQFEKVQFFPTTGVNSNGMAVAIKNGDILIAGQYLKSISIGNIQLQDEAQQSAFVAILKKNGQIHAKKIEISPFMERITGMSFDESESKIYIAGYSLKNIDALERDSSFVAKLDTSLNVNWVNKRKNPIYNDVYVTKSNKIYVSTGSTDRYSILTPANDGVGVIQFDKGNGKQVWEKYVGGTSVGSSNIPYNSFSNFCYTNEAMMYIAGYIFISRNSYKLEFDNTSLMFHDGMTGFIGRIDTKQSRLTDEAKKVMLCHKATKQIGYPPQSNFSYTWTPAEGLSNPNVANPLIQLENDTDTPINRQYILRSVDFTCSNAPILIADTVQVTISPAYDNIKIFTGSTTMCPNTNGAKYWVMPKPNYDFTWSVSGGTIENGQGTEAIRVAWHIPNPNAWVEVKTKHKIYGCETIYKLPILIDKLLKPDKPIGKTLGCIEKTETYQTSLLNNGSSYLWQTDDNTAIFTSVTNQSEATIRWTTAGKKKLWIMEANQTPCIGSSDTLIIMVQASPIVDAVEGISLVPIYASQVSYEVAKHGGSTYLWNLPVGGTIRQGQGTHKILVDWEQEGEYLLTVQETNSFGCVGKPSEMRIKVVPFLPPNAITPNGDGKNDTWFLEYIENFPAHKVQIFDRAGRQVYQSTAYKNDWDAQNLPTDVYFYCLTLHPKIKHFKGIITVLR